MSYSADTATGELEYRDVLKRDGRRLDYVFELAWASFREHPGVREYAEFQALPLSFWIIREAEGRSTRYELIVLLNSGTETPDGMNPHEELHQFSFSGEDAWRRIESFVYERLRLTPDCLTLYELPGQHSLKD